ncbi:MAG TPA: hypothetical protein PJ991_13055 [Kiritimatiellia bacterium]|nr:hypothetical protein [Kiritimatiellia bacterium]
MMDPLIETIGLWCLTGFIGGFIILFLIGSYSRRKPFHRQMSALGTNVLLSLAGPLVLLALVWAAFKQVVAGKANNQLTTPKDVVK